jgi:hypothetical protein
MFNQIEVAITQHTVENLLYQISHQDLRNKEEGTNQVRITTQALKCLINSRAAMLAQFLTGKSLRCQYKIKDK